MTHDICVCIVYIRYMLTIIQMHAVCNDCKPCGMWHVTRGKFYVQLDRFASCTTIWSRFACVCCVQITQFESCCVITNHKQH